MSGTSHQAPKTEFGCRVLEGTGLVEHPCNAPLKDETTVSIFGLWLSTEVMLAQFECIEGPHQVEVEDW